MIRAVVFDLGQVLSSPPDIYSHPAGLLGVPTDDFIAAYWHGSGRREYDEGASDEAYWGPLLTRLGVPASAENVELLASTDATIWTRIRPSAEQLIVDAKASGRLIGLLSNAPRPLGEAINAAPWRRHIDRVYVSALIGAAKPKREIYDHAAADLGVAASEIAFIDDRPENVDGALAAGWQAHLWVDDDDTRAWLSSCGVL
ncbi:MAG: HAD family phosphatase [Micropruina sp.]|uniref:HAD family hydrolase n=1 Tax=Micropruina sp. TaxID=2737536 RepID=UPI0039E6FD45